MASSRKLVVAAGAVMWRRSRKHGIKVAVIHRPRYDDWSLPKGKSEGDEVPAVTAVREVAEETGFAAQLGRYVRRVDYRVTAGEKQVHYFAAAAVAGSFVVNKEVDRLDWLPVATARERLSHARDRQVVGRFAALPAQLATVVLVRHAKAGDRNSYRGPDGERPLNRKGRAQAAAIAGELACFGPSAISAAPLARCRETVEPIASRSGLEVHDDALFAESRHVANPHAAPARLIELARRHGESGSPVICSQGGVIPDVVTELALRGGLDVSPTATRKSSYWVLSFDGARLRQADHYRQCP